MLTIEISVVVAVAFVLLLLSGAKFAVHLLKMHSNPHMPNEGDGMWQDSTLVAEGQLSLREAVAAQRRRRVTPIVESNSCYLMLHQYSMRLVASVWVWQRERKR